MITKRGRLWLTRGIALLVMSVFAVLVASTWFYSGQIEFQLLRVVPPGGDRDEVVVATDGVTVTLPLDARTGRQGRWGLSFDGGYAELGDLLSSGGGVVVWQILRSTGALAPGTAVSFDRMAFAGDPATRVALEEVLLSGPLGDYPAWLGGGTDDTWVIFVHDRGADRSEALRLLPTVAALGLPSLTVTYRNDAEAPPSAGGHVGMGRDEWEDLDAAVSYAVAEGASDVVLVGYGVGGSIVEVFIHDSRQAGRVSGIVLDAPLLDAGGEAARLAAGDKVPGFIVGWAKAVATLRYGIDWGELDHLAAAPLTSVPTLIIHGADDPLYPVAVSEAFADAAPHLVTVLVVPGAGHGESWNVDSSSYERAVSSFLVEVAGVPVSLPTSGG